MTIIHTNYGGVSTTYKFDEHGELVEVHGNTAIVQIDNSKGTNVRVPNLNSIAL